MEHYHVVVTLRNPNTKVGFTRLWLGERYFISEQEAISAATKVNDKAEAVLKDVIMIEVFKGGLARPVWYT